MPPFGYGGGNVFGVREAGFRLLIRLSAHKLSSPTSRADRLMPTQAAVQAEEIIPGRAADFLVRESCETRSPVVAIPEKNRDSGKKKVLFRRNRPWNLTIRFNEFAEKLPKIRNREIILRNSEQSETNREVPRKSECPLWSYSRSLEITEINLAA